jgi:flagellar protein FliS
MNYSEIASLYRDDSARGINPVGLVVKLYDAVLEDFRRAMNAAGAGDIAGRTASVNHALQVISELQSVLDHERGGEISLRLNGLYNVTRAMLTEANLRSTPQHFQKLIEMYVPLRQAWKQAEHGTPASDTPMNGVSAAASPQPTYPAAPAGAPPEAGDSDPAPARWNA